MHNKSIISSNFATRRIEIKYNSYLDKASHVEAYFQGQVQIPRSINIIRVLAGNGAQNFSRQFLHPRSWI